MLQPGGGGLTGQRAHRRDAHVQHRPDPGVRRRCSSARHPTVRVRVEELAAEQIVEASAAGALDLGIAYRPSGATDLWFEPLYNEEMVLVVGDSHPLAGRKRIRMVELHQQRAGAAAFVLRDARAARGVLSRRAHGAARRRRDVDDRADARARAAHADRCDRRHQRDARHAGLKPIPLESPTPIRTPGLLWRLDATQATRCRRSP